MGTPNTSLHRTPAAAPRSPVSSKPLGGRKRQLGVAGLVSGVAALAGCALALPAYNEPFDEKVQVISPSPAEFEIRVVGGEIPPVQVGNDGRAIVYIPVLPRECSTLILGVRVKDRSVEARKVVEFVRGGQVVERLSINELRRHPVNAAGYHELKLK